MYGVNRLLSRTPGKPHNAGIVSLKEESSDESTIISSQTSTLTRNHGWLILNSKFVCGREMHIIFHYRTESELKEVICTLDLHVTLARCYIRDI